VGTQVITESQITEEIKLNSFLNNEPPKFTVTAKREAADRLIDQALIKKEMEMGRYPAAKPEEAAAMIENLLKGRAKDRADFDRQVTAAGITLTELEEHLLWGLTLSHFIDLRFRPAVQVTNRDIAKYYREKLVPAVKGQVPTLEDARQQIEETLRAERSDAELDAWLKDSRLHAAIHYQKEVFGEDAAR
jgi:hypothetical protein